MVDERYDVNLLVAHKNVNSGIQGMDGVTNTRSFARVLTHFLTHRRPHIQSTKFYEDQARRVAVCVSPHEQQQQQQKKTSPFHLNKGREILPRDSRVRVSDDACMKKKLLCTQ